MNSNWKLLPASLLVAVLALAGCGGGSDEPTGPTAEERAAMMEMQEAADAIMAANSAAMALSNDSDDAAVTAAEGLIATAKDEIDDLPAADQAAQLAMLSGAESIVTAQRGRLTAEAEAKAAKDEEERIKAEQEAERMRQEAEEARMAAEAMAATAAKLYAGISAPMGAIDDTADTTRAAAYDTAETAITVNIGDGTTANAVPLSADKTAMIAANHGWAGMRYADPSGGDEYEAVVYSNVGEPTEGKKFNVGYTLAEGAVSIDTSSGLAYDGGTASATETQARIVLTGVTRTSGTETFELPDPNTGNQQVINVSGSYHGVSGTYMCDTGAARTDACSATVAANGFTLSGTWTFAPTDPNAMVMSAPDTAYASYGWWIKKAANDGPFTASAFHDFKGTDVTVDLPEAGTATYVGGAAGKYALASSTGGTNDAGHFTARAMLEAKFGAVDANEVTGTIDNFVGADGEMRDWSVKLNKATATDAGVITGPAENQTVWTIGDTAASGSGEWSGEFREQGTDGVPGVATGTFYSEYGTAGKMVGAFGANEQ